MIRLRNNRGLVVAHVGEPTDTAIEAVLPEDYWGEVHFDADDFARFQKAQVRKEASRRMQQLLGARDNTHLSILISNGQREAIRLLNKGEKNWSPGESRRAAQLRKIDDTIEDLRAASNLLEHMDDVPEDFADDRWWPVLQVT